MRSQIEIVTYYLPGGRVTFTVRAALNDIQSGTFGSAQAAQNRRCCYYDQRKAEAMLSNDGWGIGGWVAMGLLMVTFWALIVGGVIWLVRIGGRQQSSVPSDVSAERILHERFARGDMTEEDFRERRALLLDRR